MRSANPYDRNALEIRILAFLNDLPHSHPVTLDEVVQGVDIDRRHTIICTMGDLMDDGLLRLLPIKGGDQLVQLLPMGRDVLMRIYSGNNDC